MKGDRLEIIIMRQLRQDDAIAIESIDTADTYGIVTLDITQYTECGK